MVICIAILKYILIQKNCAYLSKFIYDLTIQSEGSVAAEHGLGLKKLSIKKYKPSENYLFIKKLKNT